MVIANPPYVRHETISEMAPFLRQRYSVAAGRANLLIFFYEEGVNLLRTGGVLTLITSNKFHRGGYGSKLRPFLTEKLQIETLVDFGDAPVFDAIAYASILIGTKGSVSGEHQIRACTWRPENDFSALPQTLASEGIALAQKHLLADGWRLESPAAIDLLAKLRKTGTLLGEYVGGKFYRGIITGLNEAFVLTREQRDDLIAEDRKSAKLIKPFLRGRDVKRWIVHPHDLYLIVFPHGFHSELKNLRRGFIAITSRLLLSATTPTSWQRSSTQQRVFGSRPKFSQQSRIRVLIASRVTLASSRSRPPPPPTKPNSRSSRNAPPRQPQKATLPPSSGSSVTSTKSSIASST